MDDLSQQFPWIGDCVNKMDVTNVGRQHDLTELLKLSEDIVIDESLLMTSLEESSGDIVFRLKTFWEDEKEMQ